MVTVTAAMSVNQSVNQEPVTLLTPASAARGDRLFWGRAVQVRAARRFVVAGLAHGLAQAGGVLPVELDQDLVALLVSEVVTNAVLHSASGRADGTLLVRYEFDPADRRLWVAVSDLGGPSVPRRCRHALESVGRRGLEVVEVLASRWGVGRHPRGRVVWFELDLKLRPELSPAEAPADLLRCPGGETG